MQEVQLTVKIMSVCSRSAQCRLHSAGGYYREIILICDGWTFVKNNKEEDDCHARARTTASAGQSRPIRPIADVEKLRRGRMIGVTVA